MKTQARLLVNQSNILSVRAIAKPSAPARSLTQLLTQRAQRSNQLIERIKTKYAWLLKMSMDRQALIFAPLAGSGARTTVWSPILQVFFMLQGQDGAEQAYGYRHLLRFFTRKQRERVMKQASMLLRHSNGWQTRNMRQEWQSWFALLQQPSVTQEMSVVQQMLLVQDSIENWQKQLMRQSWHKRQLFAHQLQQLFQWYPLINETLRTQHEQEQTYSLQELTYHELEQLTTQIQRSLLLRRMAMIPRKEEILLSDVRRLRSIWNYLDEDVFSQKQRLRHVRFHETRQLNVLNRWQTERTNERRALMLYDTVLRWQHRMQTFDRVLGEDFRIIHLPRVSQMRWQEWMSVSPLQIRRLIRLAQRLDWNDPIMRKEPGEIRLERHAISELFIRQRMLRKQERTLNHVTEWISLLPLIARKPYIQLWLTNAPVLQRQLTRIRETATEKQVERVQQRSMTQQAMRMLHVFNQTRWQPEQISELLLQLQQRKALLRIHDNTLVKSFETQLLVQERINQVTRQMDQFLIGGQTGQQNTYYIRERLMKQLMHLNVNDWLHLFKRIQEGNWATSDEPFWSIQTRMWNRREQRLFSLYEWLMRRSGISASEYRSLERLNLIQGTNTTRDSFTWVRNGQERPFQERQEPRVQMTLAKANAQTNGAQAATPMNQPMQQMHVEVPHLQEWTKWPLDRVLDRMMREMERRTRMENTRRGIN